jgi:hypothetical protein
VQLACTYLLLWLLYQHNDTIGLMHFIRMNQLFVIFFRNRMKLKKYEEDETKRIEEMNNNYYCVVGFRS